MNLAYVGALLSFVIAIGVAQCAKSDKPVLCPPTVVGTTGSAE